MFLHLSTLALFLGGHSTASPAYAVIFIAAAIGLRFFLYRGRSRGGYGGGGGPYRRGPWGGPGGPGGGGYGTGGSPDDPPMQWDIRKSPDSGEDTSSPAPSQAPAPPPMPPSASTDEQNPPSDL